MNLIKHFLNKINLGGKNIKCDDYFKRYKTYAFSGTKSNSCVGYEAVITRLYHTIEKGLAFENYKPSMSSIGANNLIDAMSNYVKDGYSVDADFYRTALGVLKEYYQKEKQYGVDNAELQRRIANLPGQENQLGGLVRFKKPLNTNTFNFESIMKERHSIRFFDNQPADLSRIVNAIELAQFTPSACNRQGWKTRVVVNKDVIKKLLSNQNGNAGFGQNIDRLLLVTADLRFFNASRETYQAFIDGGMYAESVINSLFYYGLASIPLSASLTKDQEKNVRDILHLDDAEILILFIGVGNFKEINQTTRSERKRINVEII